MMRRAAVVAIFALIGVSLIMSCVRSGPPDEAAAVQQIEATVTALVNYTATPSNYYPTVYQPTVAARQQEATATAQALYLTRAAYQVATPTCYAQEEESPWQDCGARRGEK